MLITSNVEHGVSIRNSYGIEGDKLFEFKKGIPVEVPDQLGMELLDTYPNKYQKHSGLRYVDMELAELREIATGYGLKFYPQINKLKIIELLEKYERGEIDT